MPIYTYHCEHCDHEFEKYQSFSEESLTDCPKCKQKALFKVYKPALVVFKGKGFYVTDTRSSNANLTPSSHKSADNGSSEKSKEIVSTKEPSQAKESSASKASE